MKTLLSLDLSSSCTGWGFFDIDAKTLLQYGHIVGKRSKEKVKLRATLIRLTQMAADIQNLINTLKPEVIVIEEVTGSKNRIAQKTLDAQHAILWVALQDRLHQIVYYDVSGTDGWRTHLQLRLSEADKAANKEAKRVNKKLSKASTELPIINMKDLAVRHANSRFNLQLSREISPTHYDIADAISLGDAFLKMRSRPR